MIESMEESFLTTDSWQDVQKNLANQLSDRTEKIETGIGGKSSFTAPNKSVQEGIADPCIIYWLS